MKKAIVGFGLVLTLVAGIVIAADPDTVSREAWRVKVDTNTTTEVTSYSAVAAGSLLSGQTAGSNTVWIATAVGTNGWVQIAIK